jgi:hypothetical protein
MADTIESSKRNPTWIIVPTGVRSRSSREEGRMKLWSRKHLRGNEYELVLLLEHYERAPALFEVTAAIPDTPLLRVTRVAGNPAATDLGGGAPRKVRITVDVLEAHDTLADLSARRTTDPDR